MNDLENIGKICQQNINRGASRSDIILYLHGRGCTIIESIKILKVIYGLSLGETKAVVTAHPVWAEVVQGADILHEELNRALDIETE